MKWLPRFSPLTLAGLAICVTLALAPPPAHAALTDPTWRMYGSPTGVYHFPLYDPVHRRMLMLGENGSTSGITVWSADLDSPTDWAPLETRGTPPLTALYHHTLALYGAVVDTRRDRLIVWGYNSLTADKGTYALSFATMTWSMISPNTSNYSGYYGRGIVYDPVGDRVVVIGGGYTSGLGIPSTTNGVSVLDLSGTPTWSDLSPTGPLPTGRAYVSTTYDAPRNRVLMFGGEYVIGGFPSTYAPLDETWELTLGPAPAWRFLPPVAPLPSARLDAYAFYDSLAGRMLVLGGKTSHNASATADLWSLDATDPDTARWTHLGNPAPVPRLPEVAILDPVRRVIVMGGGQVRDDDTYPSMVTLGARSELTLDGPPAWSTPVADHNGPGYEGTALLDAARERILVAGRSSGNSTSLAVWATWFYVPPSWGRISQSNELRDGGTFIADQAHDRIVLFGGLLSNVLQNTTVAIPMTGGPPSPLATLGAPPDARRGQCAVYDPLGVRMLVFGGDGSGAHRPFYSDVWALSLTDPPTWTRLDQAAPRPPARSSAAAVFDPAGNRLVILGGSDTLGTKQDLWSFSLESQTWTQLTPTGTAPPLGTAPSVSFDVVRQRMYLVRDNDYPAEGKVVWTLSLSGTPTWSTLATFGFGPLAGEAQSCVFDSGRDMLVLPGAYGEHAPLHGNRAEHPAQLWALCMFDWPTPVRVSLLSASADAAGAHLVWSLAGTVGQATVERRADQRAWNDVATLAPDGAGRARYDDVAVEPGHVYDYRLRVLDNGAAVQAGLASVIVPLGSQVVVFTAAPNPARALPRFVVALPAGVREARIELFDTSGRRVLTQRVLAGEGTASFGVTASRSLRSGIYQARLIAGPRLLASARLAVIR
jgi:hypothetical protein